MSKSDVEEATQVLQATLRLAQLKNVGNVVQDDWISEVDWIRLVGGGGGFCFHCLFCLRCFLILVSFDI
jgi:hypothetical protein